MTEDDIEKDIEDRFGPVKLIESCDIHDEIIRMANGDGTSPTRIELIELIRRCHATIVWHEEILEMADKEILILTDGERSLWGKINGN